MAEALEAELADTRRDREQSENEKNHVQKLLEEEKAKNVPPQIIQAPLRKSINDVDKSSL